MDITRRDAVKLTGAAAASLAIPNAEAGTIVTARSLLPSVQQAIEAFEPQAPAALSGTYDKVFRRHKSTMQVEQVMHIRYRSLDQSVRLREPEDEVNQRFIWNFQTYPMSLGFRVVPDGDPRLQEPPETRPVAYSETPNAIARLVEVFKQAREIDAAKVFNTARIYDPSVGADGVSIVSDQHPYDHGMLWSNLMRAELTEASFKAAQNILRTEMVDDRGLRLYIRPKLLIVPVALEAMAEKVTRTQLTDGSASDHWESVTNPPINYLVWDHLENQRAWFLTTSVDSLPWFERDPFRMEAWYDEERDLVMVKGYERRSFDCSNPRAILGSFPSA